MNLDKEKPKFAGLQTPVWTKENCSLNEGKLVQTLL
jgi:hypothetical protein